LIARACLLVNRGAPVDSFMFISLRLSETDKMIFQNNKIVFKLLFSDRIQSRVIQTCRQKLLEYVLIEC